MNKHLSKEIMKRSNRETDFLNGKIKDKKRYTKLYYSSLDEKNVASNEILWKAVKLILSNKSVRS